MADADRISLSLVEEADFAVTPPTTQAQGTLTLDTQPTDDDTMTINTVVYTFKDALTGASNEIFIGGSLPNAKLNAVAAINNTGVAGTDYSADNVIHPTVKIAAFIADDAILTSKFGGVVGNAIVTTETFTAGTNIFDAATLGTTTAGVGTVTLEPQRLTGESLIQDTDTTQSAEINADRQVNDIVRTNISGAGDMSFELSFLAQETLMRAALFADTFGAEVADVAADAGIEVTALLKYKGGANDFTGYTVGEWVKVEGFVNAANNGFAEITAIETDGAADDTLVVSGLALVVEAAPASVDITQLGSIINGVLQKSFSVEKRFTDLDDTLQAYRGIHVDAFDLSVAVEQIVTGSFGFIGKNASAEEDPIGSGYSATPTKDVMNAIDNVLQVIEDGLTDGATDKDCALQITFSVANNLRARSCIGQLGAISVGVGSFNVSGTIQRYFENNDELSKYLDFTDTSLAFVLEDGDGNAYVFEFPSVKFTAGASNATGQNTDIIADLTWEARKDATKGYMMKIAKLVA